MPLRQPAPKTFELGLVMAGAVSAGAYTAGVLDFLFEALGEWEKAKIAALSTKVPIPDHKVVIRVCSGASAGGICSALVAMVPFVGHKPVQSPPQSNAATGNLFYDTWVREIDIEPLLSISDLANGESVRSLLNGNALDKIASGLVSKVRTANASQPTAKPTWLANPLQLYLSLSNIRGVPYLIQMTATDPLRGHRTVAHGDYAHFAIRDVGAGDPEASPVGASPINWPGTQKNAAADGWDRLNAAALSTSAFPIGLPARFFENPRQLYDAKLWNRLPGEPEDGSAPTIAPDLRPATMDSLYAFWTVDGGAINNEPLEFARIALSGAPDAHNPRDARQANRAVIMIDPFPEDAGLGTEMGYAKTEAPNLFAVAGILLKTMMQQARFKPDELRLALHENVFSRFLIAPLRDKSDAKESNLASDGISGFAGFFSEEFRRHDFFLGRRNCQRFFQNHLVIHTENPIVQPWVQKLKVEGKLAEFHPLYRPIPNGPWVADESYVHLVPLFGSAKEECPLPGWPQVDFKEHIEKPISKDLQTRSEKVTEVGVSAILKSFGMDSGLIRELLGWFAERKLRKLVREHVLKIVKDDLKDRNLLSKA